MKNMKSLLAVILTLVMVLSFTVAASAAPAAYSITLNPAQGGHTYTAYQIFTGDITNKTEGTTTKTVLSNITWGSGVSVTDGKLDGKTAAQWADSLDGLAKDADAAKTFAQKVSGSLSTGTSVTAATDAASAAIADLAPGYYLVKDTTATIPDGEAVTYYLLQVVNSDVTITPKVVAPTLEKKVKDSDDGVASGWQDSADYHVGDTVPFQLTATVDKANIEYYSEYKMVFHDTLSEGLTLDITSIAVTINGTSYTGFTKEVGEAAADGSVTFAVDLGNVKNSLTADTNKVVVTYNATLNENAVIGSEGNPNTAYLEYSNNPNTDDTGKTPEDQVIVFTFSLVVNKYADSVSDTTKLEGAKFKLEKKNLVVDAEGKNPGDTGYTETYADAWTTVKEIDGATSSTFTFDRIDAGMYRLTETVTPVGYNTIAPVEFKVVAVHDVEADTPALTSLQVVKPDGTAFGTDENIFTVTASSDTVSISADVVNKSGVVLPSTGGMGTTLFYVVGALMTVTAAVLLITKKRMAQ